MSLYSNKTFACTFWKSAAIRVKAFAVSVRCIEPQAHHYSFKGLFTNTDDILLLMQTKLHQSTSRQVTPAQIFFGIFYIMLLEHLQ